MFLISTMNSGDNPSYAEETIYAFRGYDACNEVNLLSN